MDISNIQRNIDRLRAEKFNFYISVYADGDIHISLSKKFDDVEFSIRGNAKTLDEAIEIALKKFPRIVV